MAVGETVGFAGTRRALTLAERGRVSMLIASLAQDTRVVTGARRGVDAFVARSARHRNLVVHAVVPDDRDRVDPDWREHYDSFEMMPSGADRRAQDGRIVELADRIVAVAEHPEDDPRSRRSGTWRMVRRARQAGKPVEEHVLCGERPAPPDRPRDPDEPLGQRAGPFHV